jgi:cytoskeletal protein RodZ
MKQDHKKPDYEPAPAKPGKTLRALREERELSSDYVRQQLGLTGTLFEALENDDYGRLPAPVYVKGYLKRYAEIVQVRSAPILTGFQSVLEQEGFVEPPPAPEQPSGNRPMMAMGIAGSLLLTTSLVFGAILSDSPEESVAEGPVMAEVETVQPAPMVDTPAAESELHLEFVTDSWVEVVDANDHILTVSLQRAGSVLDLDGQPPFKMSLGYGPGVMVSYMNESIALEYDPDTFAVDMTLGP